MNGNQLVHVLEAQVNQLVTQGFDDNIVADVGDNARMIVHTGGGNDTIRLQRGADVLDGGAGAESMEGGKGNDTYIVDNDGDTIRSVA
jgi:Ca2+-binding RTX toxin-like protein